MRKLFLFIALLATGFTTSLSAQIVGDDPTLFAAKNNGYSPLLGKLPVTNNDTLGAVQLQGWVTGGEYFTGAEMRAYVSGPVHADGFAADLRLRTGFPILQPRLTVASTGEVGIGTTTPLFNLHTVGNTHTTEDFYGRIHMDDNGSIDSAPGTYIDEMYLERHNSASFSTVPVGGGLDGGLMTLAPGGNSDDHQLFFATEGIFHRHWQGDANDWGAADWYKMLTSEDINGTPNKIAKFTGESSLGDSQLWDDGNQVGLGTDAPAAGYFLEISGTTLISSHANVEGTLEVGNNALVQESLEVGKNAFVGEDISVNQNGVIGNQLKVGGITQIGGKLTVTDDTDIAGHLNTNTAMVDQTLAVGTNATPGSHSLYVGGSVLAEEVTVKLEANWPDYVFSETYQLPSLEDIDHFIAQNHHLPGFKSAKEIEASGSFELGSTQRLLVEKVEELTLHAIALNKENESLKAQLKEITDRISQLEKQ